MLLFDQGQDSSEPEGCLGAQEVIFTNFVKEARKVERAFSGLHRLASL